MIGLKETMKKILTQMNTMWKQSKVERFNEFRTFFMGIQNQPMFPNGVIYRGVDSVPRFYRGASGANDSIVPTVDNLLEITGDMPDN